MAKGPEAGSGLRSGAILSDYHAKLQFNIRLGLDALISKTAEYGLRAVIHIAGSEDEQPARANEIARDLDVPANYLSKILHAMARSGILTSGRGPRGGFRLAKRPEALTLADIVGPLEPALLEETCLLGNPSCSDHSSCAVHERWKRVKEPLMAFFRQTTVADVLRGSRLLPDAHSAASQRDDSPAS